MAADHLACAGGAPRAGSGSDAATHRPSGRRNHDKDRGHTDIYLDTDPTAGTPGDSYGAVPGAVKQWAVLADMGFPYQKPVSVRVHTPVR